MIPDFPGSFLFAQKLRTMAPIFPGVMAPNKPDWLIILSLSRPLIWALAQSINCLEDRRLPASVWPFAVLSSVSRSRKYLPFMR
jgi:hypothetical protein